ATRAPKSLAIARVRSIDPVSTTITSSTTSTSDCKQPGRCCSSSRTISVALTRTETAGSVEAVGNLTRQVRRLRSRGVGGHTAHGERGHDRRGERRTDGNALDERAPAGLHACQLLVETIVVRHQNASSPAVDRSRVAKETIAAAEDSTVPAVNSMPS